MIIDNLIENILEKNNPSIVGLDTCVSYLPHAKDIKDNYTASEEILKFNKRIIDSVSDIVPAVKVQIAYYEMYGISGLKAFADTILYAESKGLTTIADIKRGDISSTAQAYSNAFLGKNDIKVKRSFKADFITVNGYFGTDGIKPFIQDCIDRNRGMFVLVRTSNPSSCELQGLELADGRKVYEAMADLVKDWGKELIGKYGYSSVGAVVGGTHKKECKSLRERMKNTFFLVPGYGAQGASADMLKGCFDENGMGAIVNSSRAILLARENKKYSNDYAEAARQAAIDMRNDINKAIGR
ncbi:MAG: orotidine-5'-phosphate decarboxylase [Bacillota bacterium]|nr:orotidine-5'-phosphate decarboxylase [Bacillota bacterium]HHU42816.1 orotidine-5'-phosphate decarboxylase [Clostridiales bacterium]